MIRVLAKDEIGIDPISVITSQMRFLGVDPEWLVITHNQTDLVSRLAEALHETPAIVLQVPQPLWNFRASVHSTAITWVIRETPIRRILLCGHSQCGDEVGSEEAFNTSKRNGQPHSFAPAMSCEPMLGRLRQSQERLKSAKNHFAEHFDLLCALFDAPERSPRPGLQLHAQFYLAESGIFLTYDRIKRQFSTSLTTDRGM